MQSSVTKAATYASAGENVAYIVDLGPLSDTRLIVLEALGGRIDLRCRSAAWDGGGRLRMVSPNARFRGYDGWRLVLDDDTKLTAAQIARMSDIQRAQI